jgi:hypothetical protein
MSEDAALCGKGIRPEKAGKRHLTARDVQLPATRRLRASPDIETHLDGRVYLVDAWRRQAADSTLKSRLVESHDLRKVDHRWSRQTGLPLLQRDGHRVHFDRRSDRRDNRGGCVLIPHIILDHQAGREPRCSLPRLRRRNSRTNPSAVVIGVICSYHEIRILHVRFSW